MKLDALIDLCRSLPGVTEDVKWGNDLVFSVGGKMFCVFGDSRASFKVPDERFLEYTDRPQFIPAPYMARAHWVSVVSTKGLTPAELKACVQTSHALVAAKLPKRVRAALGLD